jgi:parallel beta-helix repeat protein
MKKGLFCIIVVMLMFLGTVVPGSTAAVSNLKLVPLPVGSTLYVGGGGPGNYSKIQDAINDAMDGDMVFVYDDSSPYQETLTINKSLSLVGENRETTILEMITENTTAVTISADNVSICSLTIKMISSTGRNCGIWISKMSAWPGETEIIRNVHVFNNNIEGVSDICYGINCLYLNYGNISDNSLNCKYFGVQLFLSSHNLVINNVVEKSKWGIYISNTWNPRFHLWFTHPQFGDNVISGNIVRNNQYGILLDGDRTSNDKILQNNITDNEIGIVLGTALQSEIAMNNFIGNDRNAMIFTINLFFYLTNSWHDNYWDRAKKLPVPIFGRFWFLFMYNTDFGETNFGNVMPLGQYPVVAFDWTPAQEPYDIPAGG